MLRFFDYFNAGGRQRGVVRVGLALLLGYAILLAGCGGPQSVVTYHYDNNRTGWNENEKTLKAANVSSSGFGLLPYSPISVDDQVDTQPLVVPGLKAVGGKNIGNDDVVYVTTENNSVYAIDGNSGTILAQKNLGAPVPVQALIGCNNNGVNVGINGTPVIDLPSNTMYVIAYTLTNNGPEYFIHALDITTLQDKVPAAEITASQTSPNGSPITFYPGSHRQRAALLAAYGNVYAAFASFCDFALSPDQPRGWILGWKQLQPGQAALASLSASAVTDAQAQTNSGFYLSSIWMSGSGLAAGSDGNIYAVTGNSSAQTYNNGAPCNAKCPPAGNNYSESVIKVKPDLSGIIDWFTPPNVNMLDANDWDFGSGGILLLPGGLSSPNGTAWLAAAAGKYGTMYVLNTNNLGHGGPSVSASPAPLTTENIGYCWCNESYFFGTNGPTIVSSGGGNGQNEPYVAGTVQLWSIPSLSIPASGLQLTNEGISQDIVKASVQDGGFFTSVSGVGPTAIIWAVVRPDKNSNMNLYAFSQTVSNGALTQLFKGQAGTWPNTGGNANTVPVVANGLVYVASYKQLNVFGLSH
jgi:hypothetical protein